jgi:ribosomal protein S18 acetylase RimI-like enzyme
MSAPAVTLRPMTEAEFSRWRPHSLATYAAERAQLQGRSVEEVLPEVTRQNEGFLKDGLRTEAHDLLRIVVADEPVGWLWLGPHPEKAGAAWVYEIEIDEPARGRGIGRATMLAAEAFVASRGVRELGLNVFGRNERAIHLYRSLGYATTSMNMLKSLDGATD